MLIMLLGMVLVILLAFVGISDIKRQPENLENLYSYDHRLWDESVLKYNLFEKPGYREIYYLHNLIH